MGNAKIAKGSKGKDGAPGLVLGLLRRTMAPGE